MERRKIKVHPDFAYNPMGYNATVTQDYKQYLSKLDVIKTKENPFRIEADFFNIKENNFLSIWKERSGIKAFTNRNLTKELSCCSSWRPI
ncbi:hypothetical protein MZM54_00075 [[Brevibacterium] frigoritolerans]|nr:hypothetical protein [Peribacillus frigoritolerans]